MRVLIRGSGVAGLCLAYELSRKQVDVTVQDPCSDFSRGASWLAGGMLAPWCERENAEEEVLKFGKVAKDWWDQALPGAVASKGTLVVAPPRDIGELSRFANRTSGYEWLDRQQVSSLEPDLEARFSKALFFEGEAHLDPRKALLALSPDLGWTGCCFHFQRR